MSTARLILSDMRAALVERLERRFDGEALALLGSVGTALTAIDRVGVDGVEPAAHIAVADRKHGPIGLIVFLEQDRAVEVPIEPRRMLELAGELIAAALPRLEASPR